MIAAWRAAYAQTEGTRGRAVQSFAALEYTYDSFQGALDPWHLAALSLGQTSGFGTIIARVNYARRYGQSGGQVEADAYPKLSDKTYAYLNTGYSSSSLFPDWRFGAEVFSALPHAWEASLGIRHLRFGGPPVTMLTGSVGKYQGNTWLSVRPFFRDRRTGAEASAMVTGRWYGKDAANYVGARIGYGTTPDDRADPVELLRTSSMVGGFQGSHAFASRTIATWSLTYFREEPTPGRFRNRWEYLAGAKVPF